jgi:hypothetical protein
MRAGGLPALSGVLRVAQAWKFCQNPLGFNKVFEALVRSSAGALLKFCEFQQRIDSRVPLECLSSSLLGLFYDITSEWVIYQS